MDDAYAYRLARGLSADERILLKWVVGHGGRWFQASDVDVFPGMRGDSIQYRLNKLLVKNLVSFKVGRSRYGRRQRWYSSNTYSAFVFGYIHC